MQGIKNAGIKNAGHKQCRAYRFAEDSGEELEAIVRELADAITACVEAPQTRQATVARLRAACAACVPACVHARVRVCARSCMAYTHLRIIHPCTRSRCIHPCIAQGA